MDYDSCNSAEGQGLSPLVHCLRTNTCTSMEIMDSIEGGELKDVTGFFQLQTPLIFGEEVEETFHRLSLSECLTS